MKWVRFCLILLTNSFLRTPYRTIHNNYSKTEAVKGDPSFCSISQDWWWSRSNSRNLLTHFKFSRLSLEKSKKSSSALLLNDGLDGFMDEFASPLEVVAATGTLLPYVIVVPSMQYISVFLSSNWNAISTLGLTFLGAALGFWYSITFLLKWEFQ